jgi:hypothetical protein
LPNDSPPRIRWHAVTYYRTEKGTVPVEHDLEEVAELHDLIELGPHWDTIEKIEVFRINHITAEDLTVERARALWTGTQLDALLGKQAAQRLRTQLFDRKIRPKGSSSNRSQRAPSPR